MSRQTTKATIKKQVYAGLAHLPRPQRRRLAAQITKKIMLGNWKELEKGMQWAFSKT